MNNGNYELRMTNYESKTKQKNNCLCRSPLIRNSSFVIRNCLLAMLLSAQWFVSDAYAADSWPNDPDFLVGAVGAPGYPWWTGYGRGDEDAEMQVHLLAEMGAKIYSLATYNSVDFVEKIITLCEKYGIAVQPIVHSDLLSEASTEIMVKRFKGRVKYYLVDNEISDHTIKGSAGFDISEFWMSTDAGRPANDNNCLDIRINKVINHIKIIRAQDPDAKILINSGGIHFGFFDYAFQRFAEEGVDVDLIGLNWYSYKENDRTSHPCRIDGLNSVAKYMYDRYGKDILICEYNMVTTYFDLVQLNTQNIPFLPGNGNGVIDLFEEDNMDILMGPYIVNNIRYLYNNRNENHIKGIMVYEIIEQRGHSNPWEAKFGITYSKVLNAGQSKHQILGPKAAYYHVQKLLGGGFLPIKRLNPSAAIPEYAITASVIDEDTAGAILPSQAGGTAAGSGIYRENSVVTLTAAAKPGYEFLGWYRGGIRISRNPIYKFTAVEDANNGDRDSAGGKFAYEAGYVFKGAYEGEVITFPVISKDGAKSTGTMIVPAKTFGADVKIDVKQYSKFILAPAQSYVRELNHTNIGAIINAQGKPEREMELRIPYNNSDITGMNEESLVISRYDEEKQVWVPLKSKVDKNNKQIIAYIDKVSIYAIMGTANILRAFENMKYYPNPIQPSKGLNYSKMQFSNIPAGTRIKIYTILGQIVRELEADASGMAVWDGKNNAGEKAASGVYIVYMEDGSGNKKRIKIAVER